MDLVSMELITKLVILATAIVGLYKAATFSRGKSEESEESKEPSKARHPGSSTFSALFELVGLLLFMLAFPAFIWGFSWITQNISRSSSHQLENKPISSASIPAASTPSELAYIAAAAIQDTSEKTSALTDVVTFAVKRGEFKTAISAAIAIPNTYVQAEQLRLVIKSIQAAPVAAKAASAP